ncbi:TniQ family protein [Streptomyces sp. CB01881]|uniref:TniQ family protein n=1 Tax=Streptomyces sp. CB01881 TaxID=2078691 RepID=UPI00138746B9|nr:TniQ family protein [Streptomyces sp. CB01881]
MDDRFPAALPRSLGPLPGESLPGFVLRLSHLLDLRPGLVVRCTGLGTTGGGWSSRASAKQLFMLETDVRARFARATRLSEEEVDRLTLRRWAAHYPPIADAVGRPDQGLRRPFLNREWVLPASSRYCPQCLAGDDSDIQRRHGGPWKLEWRLPVVFGCPDHNRLLADTCPGCRLPALSGSTRTNNTPDLIMGSGRQVLHPTQCRNTTAKSLHGPVCGTRLDSADNTTAALTPEQAALQTRLLELLSDDRDPVRSFQAFADLRAAAALVTSTWPWSSSDSQASEEEIDLVTQSLPAPHHRNTVSTGGRWGSAPTTSAAAACILRLADALPALPVPQLRQALSRRLGSGSHVDGSGWGRTWEHVRRDCSPQFRAQLQQAVQRQFSPAVQEIGETLLIPVRQRGYLPEHIPQRFPREWLEILVANGAPNEIRSVRTQFRRAAAILLVQATDGITAADAARFLGLPRDPFRGRFLSLTPTTGHPWKQRHISERLPEAFEALARYIAELPDPVDYYERRQRLDSWHLRQSDWENLTAQLPPATSARPHYSPELHRTCASAYIWAKVTSGEWTHAPIFRPPLAPAGITVNQTSTEYALLRIIDTRRDRRYTALREALNDHAQALAAATPPSDYRP